MKLAALMSSDRETRAFIVRAFDQAVAQNRTVVCLIAARTDTRLWHEVIFPWQEHGLARVEFLRGRITFVGAKAGATFPSALVIINEAASE